MYKRSFRDYFGNRKLLYLLFAIVLVSISTLTLVYAALNVTLNIVGTADISAASWDVHLANVNVNTQSVSGNDPTISGGTTATFSTKLEVPGDFYEFTVDVVNDGTIDAMIESVVKTPTLTTAQAKYLKYEIEYQNGESINTRQLVEKNDFVRLKVRIEFRKDVTADVLPSTAETLNLSFTVVSAQSDESDQNVTVENNGRLIKIVNGDGTQIGDEICIANECFYVINSDETSVTMLAKYNLYVGGEYNSSWVAYGSNATGRQKSNMIGYTTSQNSRNGVVGFSDSSQKGINYNDYSGSIVELYVNNYVKILEEEYSVFIENARLITIDELTDKNTFNCVITYQNGTNPNCKSSPYSWIFSTSFWTMSPSGNYIWAVNTAGAMGSAAYSTNNFFGVRPVIVMPKINLFI